MKRWILLVVLVVGLSGAATFAFQTFSLPSGGGSYPELTSTGAPATTSGPKPKLTFVEGGDLTHEFGTMAQRATGKHTWLVKNEGEGPLEMFMESSTCSCTLATFKDGKKAVVEPGKTSPIDLEWETRETNGSFTKGATIATNDPNLPTFGLHVKGEVYPAVQTYPPDPFVNFSTISNDEDEHVANIAVFSKDRPDTKITKISTSNVAVVGQHEPMSAADLKTMQLKNGEKVSIHVKSALPLGYFKEEVVITTDHPKQPELKVSIGGRMTGPITLGQNAVVMHQADGKMGSTSEISLVVRNARATKFEVEKKPEKLEVAVLETGKDGRYRLAVTVPPGSKPEKIADEIVLKTDHPKADRLIVPVSVWILGGN